MTLVVIIIVLALIFDYINGFHDAANSIATVVSTKVLTPFQAVIWAALFNFVAFFLFKDHAVANTISKSVQKEFITLPVILSGLIAAIFWNLLTWWYGIPSSSSHTLIGGFAGAAIAHAYITTGSVSLKKIVESQYIIQILLFIFLAPVIGMIISMFISIVTVMRNIWLRLAIIIAVSSVTIWMFGNFQTDKMTKNVEKFYKVDKLKKEVAEHPEKQADLDAAKAKAKAAVPYLAQYDKLGADKVVEQIALTDATVDKDKLKKEIAKADNSILRYCLIGAIVIFMLSYLYYEKIKEPNANRIAGMYKRLQLLSSAAFSIGHGGNDAQKVMGIIGAALIAGGQIQDFKELPNWVPLACYTAIGLGTMSGGWKIVKTMGTRITKVTPLEGVSAETAGAMTLFMTEQWGIPVSTTHTITGSIIGVGATKRLSAVRWGVTINLLWAWILTIPVSAVLAGIVYYIVHLFVK
ncbi:MAG: inorganic phosphate transporter [Flavihumibacter sp.]|nr:inorganic phosphate transporter [Flavihumibacter sp.]